MRKLIRPLILFCAIAGVVGSAALSDAPARQKDDKKDPKKDDKKDAKGGGEIGTIEVFQAADGWRIRVKNTEGKTLLNSTRADDTKADALKTVEALKATFAKGKVVEVPAEKKK
jgi:uncharacterized protein YegP (UPF0339 family)